MKKILLTGASRGLGKALIEFIAQQNCIVYGTVRSLAGYKDTANIKYIELDLQSTASIDKAVAEIFQKTDSLDAIIHNAGLAYKDAADALSDEERRHTFDVNFFGPVYLTEKILPYMRKAQKGKLIFISSVVSIDHWPFLGVYSASKAALENVAFEWAVLLKKWNIDVSVIRPNPLKTDMQILSAANPAANAYDTTFCTELLWEEIEDVCTLVFKILNDPAPLFEYQTGPFSQAAVDAVLKEGAYQKLLEKYRKIYLK